MQDFLKMYANIVEKCFTTCCNDFTSKALSNKEVCACTERSELLALNTSQEQCVMNCTEKWLKHSERVGARFAEANAGGCLSLLWLYLLAVSLLSQRPWAQARHKSTTLYIHRAAHFPSQSLIHQHANYNAAWPFQLAHKRLSSALSAVPDTRTIDHAIWSSVVCVRCSLSALMTTWFLDLFFTPTGLNRRPFAGFSAGPSTPAVQVQT